MVTEEFLTSKIETLKKELKVHFHQELEKVNERVQSVEQSNRQVQQEVEEVKNQLSDLDSTVEVMQSKNKKLEEENKELQEEITRMKYIQKKQEIQTNDLEQYTRKNNIRIYGLDDRDKNETAQETTYVVLNFLRNKLDINMKPSDIDTAHRLGKFQENGNRLVICRFVSRLQRMEVMSRRKTLKGTNFVIREDLTLKNAKLLECVSNVSNVKSAWSDQGKIIAELDTKSKKKETVVVTLKTNLELPLVVPEKPS